MCVVPDGTDGGVDAGLLVGSAVAVVERCSTGAQLTATSARPRSEAHTHQKPPARIDISPRDPGCIPIALLDNVKVAMPPPHVWAALLPAQDSSP
jgi:hypothetical protein